MADVPRRAALVTMPLVIHLATQRLRRYLFLWSGLLFGLVGCAQPAPTPVVMSQLPTAAPTSTTTPAPSPSATAPPTLTNTPTATPSPTPTPSPTAVPLLATGDPRADVLRDPIPHSRNLCGVIDVLDFPIDPPHAHNVQRGGTDFGVFRQRYGKFHAGEDWGGPNGQPNLGTAVYSIGHGVVTYAQPLGWGRDQGVVIVQHNYEDGTPVLSFYGHLDPDTVVLQAGDCVARGDLVGQIGQPRSSPHLHFEVRTQAPYATLTGYWPEDPTTQGWLPPSQYIWGQRLASAPGVRWAQPPSASFSARAVGEVVSGTVALVVGEELVALDASTGRGEPLALPELAENGLTTAVVSTNDTLFVADGRRQVYAYALPDLTLRWAATVPPAVRPALFPLPHGGLLVATPNHLLGLDPSGQIAWEQAGMSRPYGQAVWGDALFFTTGGTDQSEAALWRVRGDAPPERVAGVGGKLALAGEVLWLYGADGVYRLPVSEGDTAVVQLVLPLPRAFLPQSDLAPLPDGGLLLAHRDLFDSRLIALDSAGNVRWERSIASLGGDEWRLQVVGERVLLVSQVVRSQASELFVYEVQVSPLGLVRVLQGGTRTAVPQETWVTAVGDVLLLNIGGGHLVAFAPE